MNPQTRTRLFNIAALLVLVGAVLQLTQWIVAPYLFAIGSAGIAVCYLTIPVKGLGLRERRLHRFNVFVGLLMVFASGLMFSAHKEWVICLTIAALLQVYTAFASTSDKPQ